MSNNNPHTKYPQPPYGRQEKTGTPGTEEEMNPKADHGEESYKGNGRLQGKKALITGGDSGIGRAVAVAFAREGADVMINYLADEEDKDAEQTMRLVREAGRQAYARKGDISSIEACEKLIKDAVNDLGGLDILVNNAAYQMGRKSFEDIPIDEWAHTFEVNMHPMFWLAKFAVPHMKPGSSIINTTSVNAYDPGELLLPYAATKGAIQNFTANLAQILLNEKKGIRVNAVAPGPIWTPLIPGTMPNFKDFGKDTPMGRAGQPAEVAPAYVFLASDDASYIAGATIAVTGGRIAF